MAVSFSFFDCKQVYQNLLLPASAATWRFSLMPFPAGMHGTGCAEARCLRKMDFCRKCVLCSYRRTICASGAPAAPDAVESARSGVYTHGLQGCTPMRLGGVHPRGSGVYTQGLRGCTPKRLGGVHPSTARLYIKVAHFIILPHYRPPVSHSLKQNRLWAESICSQKHRISVDIDGTG